jgi:LmbE family N-acetylglucosaminyl deacetylase
VEAAGGMIALDLGQVRRLLCIGAHCDDIEIGCGGTVLTLLAAIPDLAVRWVVFTSDDTRRREAEACAARFLRGRRAEVRILDYRDAFLPYSGAAVKDEFERLKDFSPDLVLTPFRGDAHQDHRLIAELTWNTFRQHLILEYEIPKYDGDLGAPGVFVPLDAAVVEDKIRHILECYKSQSDRHWFSRDLFMALMRLRAMEANAGTDQAEAFYGRKLVLAAGTAARKTLR